MAEIAIIITITDDGKLLHIMPSQTTLSVQDDSLMQRLVFERPAGFENDNLMLLLEDDSGPYYPVNLGEGNEYSLPDALTLGRWLRLRIRMVRGGVVRRQSGVTKFQISHPGCGCDTDSGLADAIMEIVGGGE